MSDPLFSIPPLNAPVEPSYIGLQATIAGRSYDLNDRRKLRLLAYDGLGLANSRRLAQRGPRQQGDTDLGQRTDPRYIELAWLLEAVTLAQYYELREMMLEIFRAREDDPVQLSFAFADGTQRAADVYVDGVLDFPAQDRAHIVQRFSGIFKASDYRLYDPTAKTAAFLPAGEGGLPIPFTVPIPIGGDTISATLTLNYANGSRLAAPEYPVLTVYGPITDLVVENTTTGEKIDLTGNGGLTVNVGTTVVIDLDNAPRRDSKTIRRGTGESVDEYLTTDSDLATWHLAPAGEKLPAGTYGDGNNVISVSGTGVNGMTQVVLAYYDRYEGK